jgi:hypothetical protein
LIALHVGHVAASVHGRSPPPLDELLELEPLLEDVAPSPASTPLDVDELPDEPELEAPELEPPVDVDDQAPELEELEPEAATASARLPPSSAGDSPSPSPIWARASPGPGAIALEVRNSSPPQAATLKKKIP